MFRSNPVYQSPTSLGADGRSNTEFVGFMLLWILLLDMEKTVATRSYNDGEIDVIESYLGRELDLITLKDGRSRVTNEVYGNRCVSVSFIFDVVGNKLEISRIFANTETGGSALDSRPSLFGRYYVRTFKRRDLLDEESLGVLNSLYPDYSVDLRRFLDIVRDLLY